MIMRSDCKAFGDEISWVPPDFAVWTLCCIAEEHFAYTINTHSLFVLVLARLVEAAAQK